MTTDGIQNRFSRAEIAEALEISGNQILQYQERGLLADRSVHAQDIAYNSLDIARLRFILRCEAAGYQGKEVMDFIGTINKGTGIKEQLKASLVHAHQKFSYVNAQKRKADILEQVNLQADADLIQKYINEMKGIVANPQSSLIDLPVPKPRPDVRKTEQPSKFKPEPKKAIEIEPEPERRSRLKAGLERSHKLKAEYRQPAAPPPRPIPTPRPASHHKPPRAVPPKSRNQFIDSSSAGTGYNQRMSDGASDMFINYSGYRKSNSSSAWKQTLVTFLVLSLLSLAGYAYYAVKYQKASIEDLTDAIEKTIVPDKDLEQDKENDVSAALKNILADEEKPSDQQTDIKPENSAPITPKTVEKQKRTPPPPKKEPVEKENDALEKETVKQENSTAVADTTTNKKEIPPSNTPVTKTMSPEVPSTYKAESNKPESFPDSSQTQTTDPSLSGTAMKDLDDLLAKKQRTPQESTDVYAIAERPQVAVYDFKIFYQRSRKILISKFKMARIRPQRNIIQGRLFVVFKPRQSSQNTKYFSVPDARIADGIPTEPFKGIEFSFSESTKVQSVRTIYVRDPSQFDVATVFVFSNAGELVLKKDFTVTITEY